MGVQRSMPSWLVALLVLVPCSAFPRVSRLTNEEIHQQVEKKGWAKTRVDKPEDCDREKCPKMMDICPEGGHCYVTGDCGDDGCLCHIKIACKEKNEKENQEHENQEHENQEPENQEPENQEPENQEPTEEEVGTDYSDDGDDDHQDGEHHHKDEHTDEVEKEGHNFNHVSCLKNIHNESYCQGWKNATCDMKNRQECCGQEEWSRGWKSSCGAKMGTCEEYVIPHNESCCWRLTCPQKEGHDYMESSDEKPHKYEEEEEEEEEEDEVEEEEEDDEEDEKEEGNGDKEDGEEVSEGDEEEESEGADEDQS